MSPAELRHDVGDRVVDVEVTRLGGDLGVEDDLQQDVAKLVGEPVHVAGLDGGDRLVRLLHEVAAQGQMRLLQVPGAALRAAQDRHDANEFVEAPGGLDVERRHVERRSRPRHGRSRQAGHRRGRQSVAAVGQRGGDHHEMPTRIELAEALGHPPRGDRVGDAGYDEV
jgi:hypothetical protein